MKKLGTFCGGLIGMSLIVSASAWSHSDPVVTAEHVPGEVLIKLKTHNRAAVAAAITAVEERLGENSVLQVRSLKTDPTMHVFQIANDPSVKNAIEALKKDDGVEIAEPNYLYHTFESALPNDPDFEKLWGLKNIGQKDSAGQIGTAGADIQVAPLWSEGFHGLQKILVAVIDTGIDWTHPDLQANIYTNPRESGANGTNGRDDDGNGFIDDIHGWNFYSKNNNSRDDNSHGTHCAGTIGGIGDNGVGVSGVNWQVSLLPVKFLSATGSGSLDAAVEAVNYATAMKVNVMSNSWGGRSGSEALKQAIEKARDAGILFVAAAGNDGTNNDTTPTYPATFPVDNIVAVAATDNQDRLASFSSFGPRTVHVAAPGVQVYSTIPDGKYGVKSGTSMAAPHIAGIAALLLSGYSDWSYAEVKNRLIKTSDPVAGLKKKVMGRGRVNAHHAFHGIVAPTPNEPDPSLWRSEPNDVESVHPYTDNQDLSFTIRRPGAKFLRIHFEKVETEANYDKIFVQSPAGEAVDELTGTVNDYLTEYVEGDTAVVRFKSDTSVQGWGFKVDQIQIIE